MCGMKRMRKHLSAPGLLSSVRKRFKNIKDPLSGRTDYSIENCLMSGLAIFGLKFPSLLQFDKSREDEDIKENIKNLYGVEKVPCDTYMRERLDKIDPKRLRRSFKACFSSFQNGKMLPLYHFIDDYVLVTNDGTGIFYSDNVHCDHCCKKHHRDGSISYYHQMLSAVMVHPDEKVVLPLTMEPILKQDGNTKNDCEINASKRLLNDLRHMHPKLKMVIVEDGLYANAPHIQELIRLNYRYIIIAKPKNHKWLFSFVNNSKCETSIWQRDNFTYEFRWLNDVPLNESNEKIRVNFLELIQTSPKGKKTIWTWITDFTINKNNVFQIMRGGRARWKIENETFNTLKTQGYHFEHNYGHGYKYLNIVLANLMMLAFLIDQIQQLCCPKFKAALKKLGKKLYLWQTIRAYFSLFIIKTWDDFYAALIKKPKVVLAPDTS